MVSRRIALATFMALLAAGCSSGGSEPAAVDGSTIEAYEARTPDAGPYACGLTGPRVARLYRSHDGSFAWLDDGVDGEIDAISAKGTTYLADPATDDRWIAVPAGLGDPLSLFASFLLPWARFGGAFDAETDPMRAFQDLQDEGKDSPAPMAADDPQGFTATWTTDDDGRVIEATLRDSPDDSDGVSTELLPPSEAPPRPPIPTDAVPFEDEPLGIYLPRSYQLDPACGVITDAALAEAQPCLDAAIGDQTVGEWVEANAKQELLMLPRACA